MNTPRLPRLPRLARALVIAIAASAPMLASADNPGDKSKDTASPSAASAAQAALSAYLELWKDEGRASDASSFAEDLVLRYAHTNPELRGEVRGRTSAITQIRAVARLGASWQFRDMHLFPTLHDNVYFAQFRAAGTAPGGGPAIEQNVVLALELDGRKLVRLVEFANPAIGLASRTARPVAAAQ